MAYRPLPHEQQKQYSIVRLGEIALRPHPIQAQYIDHLDIPNMNEKQINELSVNMRILVAPDQEAFRNIIFPLVQGRQKQLKDQKKKLEMKAQKRQGRFLIILFILLFCSLLIVKGLRPKVYILYGESVQIIQPQLKEYLPFLMLILTAGIWSYHRYIYKQK